MGKSVPHKRGPGGIGAAVAVLLAVAVALAACKPQPAATPAELPGAASEPASAVRRLAQRLHDNDLVGFATAAVPASEYVRLRAAWRDSGSRWPLTLLPLDDQLLPLLKTLSAPEAETRLKRGYDLQLANQNRDLRDAARNLGLFGVKYVQERDEYTEEERRHYAQAIAALSAWGQQAPLGDPKRAHATIDRLCAAARRTGIDNDETLRTLGMEQSLRRLAPFFAEIKAVLDDSYGLPLDQALTDLRSGLVAELGEHAQVQVRYPLAGKEIDTVVDLERRYGRWYLAGYLRDAEKILAAIPPPPPEEAAPEPAGAAATRPAD
ncbi:hypothetical protein GCM10027084_26470 [Pseudoxanthomonas sangjuensis]|uniref:hypothetical protein n=1 Tax=Pseudoxanthomonas sangjuensis TaxID=1503750 RepID=UPI001392085A|nr:hypothetical protein [Pseudoxanthomonas sangjuensis]KAF1714475.1 hypothetical protein CSC71_03625 [Pseudoxanthomonas sangjuensis]